jgi:methylated-DNA-protein-cysteine methyltransferase-like protein
MKNKKAVATKESLRKINPSGKRDENFFQLVYDIVRQIPIGRVTSYGAIAAALGAKSSARMVGWAMNGSHRMKPRVPAQRVVNRQGLLSGRIHFDYPEQMQELLEKEGVKIEDNQVVNFNKKFWDPVKELGLE